jgi:stress response protein YsnF
LEGEQVTVDTAESEQEVVLHEARAKVTKETVPVERVRLSVRKIEEDKTVTGEIRRERIEVIDDGSDALPPRS